MSMLGMRQLALIFWKDVRVEIRTKEIIYTSLLFAVVLVTVFVFSGFSEIANRREAAPGIIQVCSAFVGTVIFGRTFQRERDDRAIVGLILTPGLATPLFAAKFCVNLVLLSLVNLLILPAVFATQHLPSSAFLPAAAILWAGSVGFSALGTVLAASLATIRLREVLLPLVLYPLCLPLFVFGVRAISAVVLGGDATGWIKLIVAFDLLFLLLSGWLFGQVLEE